MNDESNPYRTPESDVSLVDPDSGIKNFERFSAWAVFGLTIITLGIYPIYWMYTRSQTLNTFYHDKISPVLLTAFVIFVIVSFFSGMFEPTEMSLVGALAIVNVVYTVLYLTVLFKLRNRLNDLVEDNINPVITFFGSAIYLQYAVNKSIDKSELNN